MFYLKTNSDGLILDCVDYFYEDYIPFNGDVPQFVNGGWFKLIGNDIVEIERLNPRNIDNIVASAIDEYTLSLIEGGLL